MKKHLQILILLFLSSLISFGQAPIPLSECGNPVAHDICSKAPTPTLCELDGYTFTTNDFTKDNDPVEDFLLQFCGSGTVTHNNLWIGFIAESNKIHLNFDLSQCPTNSSTCNGIQAAIIDTDCRTNPTYANSLECINCVNSDFDMNANNLIPGKEYFIMVDGCCADICNFTLNVIDGLEENPPTNKYEYVCDETMISIDTAVINNPNCNCEQTVITHKELALNDFIVKSVCNGTSKAISLFVASTSQDSFNVIINEHNYGNYPVRSPNNNGPYIIPIDNLLDANQYTITVTEISSGCSQSKEIDQFSCGDCHITNLTATPDTCHEGTADILIDFDIENGLNHGFVYTFNGLLDIEPTYPDAPISVNLGLADGQQVILTVRDLDNLSCFAKTEFTAPECESNNLLFIDTPDDITVECNNVPELTLLEATTTCPNTNISTYTQQSLYDITCYGNFVIVRAWVYTDECENEATWTQNITVQDNTPPELINVPEDITVESYDLLPKLDSTITATDNCDTNIIITVTETFTEASPSNFVTRKWTATDHCGNVSMGTQIITIDSMQDCNVNIFSVNKYCNTDGTLDLLISYEIENGLDEGLDVIFTDGPTYNFINTAFWDDTARILLNNIMPAIGQEVNFKIEDKNNSGCFAEYQLTAPNCEGFCYLDDMTITENCESDSLSFTFNLDYEGTSDTFFITGNGVDLGFAETTIGLPITITPEDQDLDSYEYTFTDINNPDCTITLIADGCEGIWPGDINLDGMVNNLDLVYIGIANSYEGTPRETQSIEWEVQFGNKFDQSFENGVNYANADCDGSGIIDENDILAIMQNYNKTHGEINPHGYIKGTASDPILTLDLSELTGWKNGQAVSIPIILGDENIPMSNVYGLSFDILYPEELFQDGLTLKIEETWMNNADNILIQRKKNGVLEIGISQKDGEGNTGSGVIARLEGIIDDLTGMPIVEIGFDNVEALTKTLEIIPVRYEIESIVLGIENPFENEIDVYPNPTTNILIFEAPKVIQSIEIIDMLGQSVHQITSKNEKVEFSTSKLAEGVYFAKISIDGYVYVKKFEIMR